MLLKYPIKIARKIITKWERPPFKHFNDYAEFSDPNGNTFLKNQIKINKPYMVCKFGTTELACLRNFLSIKSQKYIKDIKKYIKREKQFLWWWDVNNRMASQSGFFPATDKNLEKFSELMLKDIKDIDILASYIQTEILLKDELSHTKKITINSLIAPYRYEDPWTESLEGKRILVVHHFEESIINQYKKREFLWKNPKMLPEFELFTMKSVLTLTNKSSEFKDWFDALNYMKDKISNIEFDIALIGCGAYGLPLAAHVKRMGKIGIHLGAQTQILFGIYGTRWAQRKEFADLINEHWVRPLKEETPENHIKLEKGAYW